MSRIDELPVTDDSETPVSLILGMVQNPSDDESWARFVDRYGPLILRWSRSWGLQDCDAHNLTQTVLLKLLRGFHRFEYDPSKSFRGWLRKVTENAWAESLRASPPLPSIEHPRLTPLVSGLEAREDLVQRIAREFDLELKEKAENLVRARVGEKTWDAYWLTEVEGLTALEAAGRLGIKYVAHVYSARHTVKKMLKDELQSLQERQR
jgi:RNA polymerase sigma-70 factor (ECF subfamily)